jgi:hypothetical protein
MTGLHLGIVGVLVAAVSLVGCGDDTTSTTAATTTGAGGAPTTSSASTNSGGGEGGEGGSGGAGGQGGQGGAGGSASDCGDGVVEGAEQCEPPDTPMCTANCQIPSSCEGAPEAVLGDNVGDTQNGMNTADGSCQLGDGFDQVWQFTPAQDGMLTMTLSPVADMGIHVRSTCDDLTTELGCVDALGEGMEETLTIAVTQGTTIYIFADGYVDRLGGPYTLTLALE